MARGGRPPVLDEIKQREILALLTVGCSLRVAARYVGCNPRTIRRTAQRDARFAGKLRQAQYHAEIGFLKNIQRAARKEQYWRAAAWALERKFPQRYARRDPEAITMEQLTRLLSQFAQIVVDEVPVAAHRKRILKRLEQLTASLRRAPSQRSRGHDQPD